MTAPTENHPADPALDAVRQARQLMILAELERRVGNTRSAMDLHEMAVSTLRSGGRGNVWALEVMTQLGRGVIHTTRDREGAIRWWLSRVDIPDFPPER